MSRFRFFPILFLIVLSAQIVFAQDQSEQDAVASALAKYYPKLQSAQINPTPISGVYEVVVDNNEIVYFSPATGLIFCRRSVDPRFAQSDPRKQRPPALGKDQAVPTGQSDQNRRRPQSGH